MGSLQADSEEKQEMDDSGCIQDVTDLPILTDLNETPGIFCSSTAPPATKNGYYQEAQLLDLSDDVLLLILKHLAPWDLKALGFTCPRLGALVLDRSLWLSADARAQPWGSWRLRWYIARALHAGTKELLISGYARETSSPSPRVGLRARKRRGACPGARYTVAPTDLRHLAEKCPHLTTLALEYCNFDCKVISISNFPPTLKDLSLRGSKCFNQPVERWFLFKIQDYLPGLESLDLCNCEWLEPSALLPLSKLPALRRLYLRDCLRFTEFVAYASLATRYGFLELQVLDLRGSPVGDSEVSGLGWLASLHTLKLSPAEAEPPAPPTLPVAWEQTETSTVKDRDEQTDDLPPPFDPWEENDPDYYKVTSSLDFEEESKAETWSCDRLETNDATARENDAQTDSESDSEDKPSKRKLPTDAGPSKRSRKEPTDPNAGPSTSTETEREAEPRHHVLDVNVGQQLHVVYRVSSQNDYILQGPVFDLRVNPRNVPLLHNALHLDGASIVTDSSIRRFGRADGEDINYVHIGINGPYAAANLPGTRPNRSSLRHLSITGYRYITDRSLVHLATAAPELEFLDLSRTNVTEEGVEKFRSIRPDCEVIFSKYIEKKQ